MSDNSNSANGNSWTILSPEAKEAVAETVGPASEAPDEHAEPASSPALEALSGGQAKPAEPFSQPAQLQGQAEPTLSPRAELPERDTEEPHPLQQPQEPPVESSDDSAPLSPTHQDEDPAPPSDAPVGHATDTDGDSVSVGYSEGQAPPSPDTDSFSDSYTHISHSPESAAVTQEEVGLSQEEVEPEQARPVAEGLLVDSEVLEERGSEGDGLRRRKVSLLGPLEPQRRGGDEEEEEEEEFRPPQREEETGLSLNKCILGAVILLGLGTIFFSGILMDLDEEGDMDARDLKDPELQKSQEWLNPEVPSDPPAGVEPPAVLERLAKENQQIAVLQAQLEAQKGELKAAQQQADEGVREYARREELERENERMKGELEKLPGLQRELERENERVKRENERNRGEVERELELLRARVVELTHTANETSASASAPPPSNQPSSQDGQNKEKEKVEMEQKKERKGEKEWKKDKSAQKEEGKPWKERGGGKKEGKEQKEWKKERSAPEEVMEGKNRGERKEWKEAKEKKEGKGWKEGGERKEFKEKSEKKEWREEKSWKKHGGKEGERKEGKEREGKKEKKEEKEWKKGKQGGWNGGGGKGEERKEWNKKEERKGETEGRKGKDERKDQGRERREKGEQKWKGEKEWNQGKDGWKGEKEYGKGRDGGGKEWRGKEEKKQGKVTGWSIDGKKNREGRRDEAKEGKTHGGKTAERHETEKWSKKDEQRPAEDGAARRHHGDRSQGGDRDRDDGGYWAERLRGGRGPPAGCVGVPACAQAEGLAPVPLPDFEALLLGYLGRLQGGGEGPSSRKRELAELTRQFFTAGGVFVHDRATFREFAEEVAEILEDMAEEEQGDGEGDDSDEELEEEMEGFEREAMERFALPGGGEKEERKRGEWKKESGRVKG